MPNMITQEYTGPHGYDVMQVCINGHLITDMAETHSDGCQNFCANCGAKTITQCEKCNAHIRGYYHSENVFSTRATPVPKYCIQCGTSYPWQAAALESLKEILAEGELEDADLQTATQSLPDIVHDGPKTELATFKLKRVLGKLQKPLYEVAIKVLSDVATETAKKALGL